jgi:hypothetical protein
MYLIVPFDIFLLIIHSPFIPDADEPTVSDDENEPYSIYYEYLLSKTNDELPQVISNSYGDDEQVRLPKSSFYLSSLLNSTRPFLRSTPSLCAT